MSTVYLVTYPGAQSLDVTGPAEVFGSAARLGAGAEVGTGSGAYDVVVAAPGGGAIPLTSGLTLVCRDLATIRPVGNDTVLVGGGDEGAIRAAHLQGQIVPFLAGVAGTVRRLGSVCSGAFFLASAGLLDGRRVATHWSACERLARFRPTVQVDRDAIYLRNGTLWTSAGVTTGIDMALAMVEEDHGSGLADAVAAQLVLHARRPGFQSQFSDALLAQRDEGSRLAHLLSVARRDLRTLDVPALARLAGLSERTLHRRCLTELGETPAKVIERLRVEQARDLLVRGARSQKEIAAVSGFGSVERMGRAFRRVLGLAPSAVKLLQA